ncbi:MAG TPA: hypothetical protein DCE23_00570 [Firmicutes bacterium]|nr:hypothetical protein [Bacillota bacterium]
MDAYLFVLALLPSIVLGWFIYKKDKFGKESKSLLIQLLVGGICSAFLTEVLSSVYDLIFPNLSLTKFSFINEKELVVAVFIGIGFIEEFSKWIFLKNFTWKNKEFDHIYDAIVYAVFVSLGFATLENILYIKGSPSLDLALKRAILSVPGHVFNAIIMGTFYGQAKKNLIEKNRFKMNINLLLSIIMPAIAHGFFDFLLLIGTKKILIIFYSFVAILYIISFITINKVSKIKYNFKDLICPNCGNVDSNDICSVCGNRLK